MARQFTLQLVTLGTDNEQVFLQGILLLAKRSNLGLRLVRGEDVFLDDFLGGVERSFKFADFRAQLFVVGHGRVVLVLPVVTKPREV